MKILHVSRISVVEDVSPIIQLFAFDQLPHKTSKDDFKSVAAANVFAFNVWASRLGYQPGKVNPRTPPAPKAPVWLCLLVCADSI